MDEQDLELKIYSSDVKSTLIVETNHFKHSSFIFEKILLKFEKQGLLKIFTERNRYELTLKKKVIYLYYFKYYPFHLLKN